MITGLVECIKIMLVFVYCGQIFCIVVTVLFLCLICRP